MDDKFFDPAFWFNPSPDSLIRPIFYTLILLGVFMVVFSYFGVKHYSKIPAEGKFKKWWKKIENFLAINGLITLFLCFCSYELIPYFHSRIVFVAWAIFTIAYSLFLYKKRITIQKRVDSYLPR